MPSRVSLILGKPPISVAQLQIPVVLGSAMAFAGGFDVSPSSVMVGGVPIGLELLQTGKFRLAYEQGATTIAQNANLTPAEKKAARKALKNAMRNLQTKLGQAYTEALLKQRKAQNFKSSGNNPGKTNARVNAQAKLFRAGGRILKVAGIGSEAYTIATAENPLHEVPRSAGRLGGMCIRLTEASKSSLSASHLLRELAR